MALAIGDKVGPYEVLAPIGAGGMGEVYRAVDTNLDREVAIKVLPTALAQDPERLARFKREAKVLAALNHPHIAQIYAVEDPALIMELVNGEAPRGAAPLEKALDYARQIAEALEAAHEKGIVHRDLKPANIKVTPEGVVKVLDFGLAAFSSVSSIESDPANSPTMTMAATQAGIILGTAAYMSPEQAAGKSTDKRTDIWSFGVVLYEMLTGRRLFEGETVTHTLAGVLRGPIDFDALPTESPPAVRTLLRSCLDRNPKTRLRDIGEARIAIDTPSGPAESAPTPPKSQPLFAWITAALSLLVAVLAFIHFRETPPASPNPLRFEIPVPGNAAEAICYPALFPDGRKLAFISKGRLWVHSLESGESRDLARADRTPFWSPDSRFIAYTEGADVKKIEATGGPPQTVVHRPGVWGGAWNRDGVIVFADEFAGYFRVPASGGVPVQLTTVDSARRAQQSLPSFLADGRHFVFSSYIGSDLAKSAIRLSSLDAKPDQPSQFLLSNTFQAQYTPSADPNTGWLLFDHDGALMAQPFDNHRFLLKGQAARVADNVLDNNGHIWETASFSVSASGALAFQTGAAPIRQLTLYDRRGNSLGTTGESGYYSYAAISPDGARLAVVKVGGKRANIWLLNLLEKGAGTRLTFGDTTGTSPIWSPDGSRIVFTSNRTGARDLYQKPADGSKEEEPLLQSGEYKAASSWSSDGRFLLYVVVDRKTRSNIWVLPLFGAKPVPFQVTEAVESQPRFSPDGRWVAYQSDESGQSEIYVRSFAMNAAGTAVEAGGKWQVSTGSGSGPRWRRDGRELYYVSGQKIMAVDTTTSPAFHSGAPHPVGPVIPESAPVWEVTPDGNFLVARPVGDESKNVTVVVNWEATLKK
jgi:serine/threonine protein kinase/Tol biopolymer transport system component